MAKEKIAFPTVPTVKRWVPDFRYRSDKLADLPLNVFKSTEDSVTDKEAYRVTLASMRGMLASGSGSITHGNYELKPGQEYDPNFDLSYFMRPDVDIVEIDQATKRLREQLDKYDGEIKLSIQEQLKALEKQKETIKQNKDQKEEKKSE